MQSLERKKAHTFIKSTDWMAFVDFSLSYRANLSLEWEKSKTANKTAGRKAFRHSSVIRKWKKKIKRKNSEKFPCVPLIAFRRLWSYWIEYVHKSISYTHTNTRTETKQQNRNVNEAKSFRPRSRHCLSVWWFV